MRKVLLFTESLGAGGAERQLCGLADLLKQRGYHVTVITYYENGFYEAFLKERAIDHRCVTDIYNKKKGLFILRNIIKEINPQTVISFLPEPNMRMCIACMFNKVRLIVSERSHTSWKLRSRIRYFLYKRANIVVANSFTEAENIKAHCRWLKKKTISICNYVDTERFSPLDDFRKTNQTTLQIISVGRIYDVKNIERYIKALKIVCDRGYKVSADWYGKINNEDYYQNCLALIQELGLSEVFHFYSSKTDIEHYYQKADLFCLPSIFEGYPNVLCEAMSCGVPAICSNVCDNPRINKDGETGFLFDPYRIEEISDSIIRFINLTEDQKLQMRLNCRKRAVNLFDENYFLQQYEKIL